MTMLKDLKKGDQIHYVREYGCGIKSNGIITDIQTTKTGRLKIKYAYDYTYQGQTERCKGILNHSPVLSTTLLSDYGWEK